MKKMIIVFLLFFATFLYPLQIYRFKLYTYSGKITKVDVEKRWSILYVNNNPFIIPNEKYFFFLQKINQKITVSYTVEDILDVTLYQVQKFYGYWEN